VREASNRCKWLEIGTKELEITVRGSKQLREASNNCERLEIGLGARCSK